MQACCESAKKGWNVSNKPENFFHFVSLPACACVSPDLEWVKFRTLKVCDLTLEDDTQTCCKSAEQL